MVRKKETQVVTISTSNQPRKLMAKRVAIAVPIAVMSSIMFLLAGSGQSVIVQLSIAIANLGVNGYSGEAVATYYLRLLADNPDMVLFADIPDAVVALEQQPLLIGNDVKLGKKRKTSVRGCIQATGYATGSIVLSTPFVLATYVLTQGSLPLRLIFAVMQCLGSSMTNSYFLSGFIGHDVPYLNSRGRKLAADVKALCGSPEPQNSPRSIRQEFLDKLGDLLRQYARVPQDKVAKISTSTSLRTLEEIVGPMVELVGTSPIQEAPRKGLWAKVSGMVSNSFTTLISLPAGIYMSWGGTLPFTCAAENMMQTTLDTGANGMTTAFAFLVTLPFYYMGFEAGFAFVTRLLEAVYDMYRYGKIVPTSWLLSNAVAKTYSFLAFPLAALACYLSGYPAALFYANYCFLPNTYSGRLAWLSTENIDLTNAFFGAIFTWFCAEAMRLGILKIFGEEHEAFYLRAHAQYVRVVHQFEAMSDEEFERSWPQIPLFLKEALGMQDRLLTPTVRT